VHSVRSAPGAIGIKNEDVETFMRVWEITHNQRFVLFRGTKLDTYTVLFTRDRDNAAARRIMDKAEVLAQALGFDYR